MLADRGTIAQDRQARSSTELAAPTGSVTHGDRIPGASASEQAPTGLKTWLPPQALDALERRSVSAASTLTINATFGSTLNADANAATIKSTISTAIAVYQAKFTDPITVTINFDEMPGGLGQSNTYFKTVPYSTYLSALKSDGTSADDGTALSHLPSSSTSPVNGSSTIDVTTANLRAVGMNGNPPGGEPDGYVSVNTSMTSPGSPGTSGQYDLLAVVEHEIDEVLGLGSSLPDTTSDSPEDLYRYDQNGVRSFSTSNSVTAFFSIDGSTAIAQFHNKLDGADFGDWESFPLPPGVSPQVQDAFATPNTHPRLGPSEIRALDVIGYNVAPVFTDDPLVAGTTPIKAVHITELRSRIDAQRQRFGLAAFSYTDPTLTAGTTIVKTVHVNELRTALSQAYVAAGKTAPTFTDSTLTAGTTVVKAVHITELRSAIITLEGS